MENISQLPEVFKMEGLLESIMFQKIQDDVTKCYALPSGNPTFLTDAELTEKIEFLKGKGFEYKSVYIKY